MRERFILLGHLPALVARLLRAGGASHVATRRVAAILAGVALLMLRPPDFSQAANFLFIQGEPDEYLTAGQIYFYTEADGSFTASSLWNEVRQIAFFSHDSRWWYLQFGGKYGQRVRPGTYENAAGWPLYSGGYQPVMGVSGNGSICFEITGRFVVYEAVYESNLSNAPLLRFAADFEQRCLGREPGLRGAIRFNSDIPCKPGDNDCDGLADGDEAGAGTDPWNPDADRDALTDGEEVNGYGTDPHLADTDGDTLSDAQEAKKLGTDPTDADSDDDGIADADELRLKTDPNHADPDGDGLTDPQELEALTDPSKPDTDGDGLSDGEEILDAHTNPKDPDTDRDGLTDYDELRVRGTDPRDGDPDRDLLNDSREIALGTDPFKPDTDGDGMTDGYEAEHGLSPLEPFDASTDPDADGLTTLEESTLGSDPNVADTDGDGFTDGREVHDIHTSPLLADTDGDGLGDQEEVQHGCSPLILDTDGDQFSDYQEVRLWGTSPTSRSIAYLLPGSLSASSGGYSQSIPITELLFLSADRSYAIGVPSGGTGQQGEPERGVWFRNGGQLLFYQQNFFEALSDLAEALQPQLGAVTIILRSYSRSATINERSGVMSVRGTTGFKFLTDRASGPIGITYTDRGTGPFSEIPVPQPTSAEGNPAAASPPVVGTATPQVAVVPATTWSVMGTLTTRMGKTSEVRAVSGSLALNGDQTFSLDLGDDETPMRGMWFQDGNRTMLYVQNLLEQTLALERSLSIQTGEPVRVELLRVRDGARSDSRTGFLLLTFSHRHTAALARSGLLLPVSTTWNLTATPGVAPNASSRLD